MARRVVTAVALAALALSGAGSAARTTSPAPGALVITGHGWGHGVGMSQWGAYGYALHGWDATRILAHYFPGTTLGTHPATRARVLLTDGAGSVTVGSTAPWRLVDASGAKLKIPAGELTLPASLKVPVTLKHKGKALVSPLSLRPGAAPLQLDDRAYRGSLTVVSDGTALQVVNVVPLEGYLGGVVGEEVSSAWPQAALEAQAIAARSYALAQLARTDPGSTFDLYADGRDQVYGGIAAESPAITAAVAATRRRVVLYHGTVATTYFSSSSGGETASAADAMGIDIPYLVSVPDPWDTYAPYHDWGPVLLTPRLAAKELGLHGPLVNFELEAEPDGRVISATLATARKTLTLTGAQFRDALGLRSSWFQLQWAAAPEPAADADTGMTPPPHAP